MENQIITRQNVHSKYLGRDSKIVDSAKSGREDSSFDYSSKEIAWGNENIDCNLVIKQFDDLISELSESRCINKKCTNNLFSTKLDSEVKNIEPCEENCTDSACFEKVLHPTQSCNLRCKKLEHKTNCIDLKNDMHVSDTEQSRLDKTLSGNNLGENSLLLKDQDGIPWINSHLWHLENKKQSLPLLKLEPKNKNMATNILTINAKGNDIKLSEYLTCTYEHNSIFNPVFYSKHFPRKDMHYSCYKSAMKYDSKSFPYAEACFKGQSVSNSVPGSQRINKGGAVSLLKSSKPSASKYAPDNCFLVKLFIETKAVHLGPFSFEIYSKMSLRLLKLKVEQEHGISASSQRWILGKCFAVDNEKPLADYNVLPGSSIILYVDNKKISGDRAKNKFAVIKHTTQMNKVLESNMTTKEKERSDSFDSLANTSSFRESRELIRKDSLDSKFNQLCSETRVLHHRKLSSQSSDKSSIDMPFKQHISNPVFQKDVISDKNKSPVIKRKFLKKNIEPTKTKIIHQKQDVYNYTEKSLPEKRNFNNFEGCANSGVSSIENTKCTFKNTSVEIRSMYNVKATQSKLVSLDYAGSAFNSNTDISEQYNEQVNSNFIPLDTLDVSEKHNLLISCNMPFKNMDGIGEYKVEHENTDKGGNSKYSRGKFKNLDPYVQMKENLNQSSITPLEKIECVENLSSDVKIPGEYFYENKDAVINEVNNHDNIRKHDNDISLLTKEPGNLNQSNVNQEKNNKERNFFEIRDFDETKNEGTSVTDRSDLFSVKEPENQIYSNMYCVEKNKNMENFEDNLKISTNRESKPKSSVTSLIRKLSLTHKAKLCVDDSSSQGANSILHTDVIADSKHPTLNSNQSFHNGIHIEISPEYSNIPVKNESTEHVDYNLQKDLSVPDAESIKNFEFLMEIENMDLVENTTNFTCPVCFDEFESGQGVILHDCLHTFCRDCLSASVRYSDCALVKCPYCDNLYSCQSHLQQREIKALVSEDVYEKYLQRSIITAEGLAERSFHCKAPDCSGWCVYDNAINVFHCPVCFHYNCLNCQAIHEGLNCRQYENKLKLQQKVDKESEKTLELLNKMIESGKALHCPKCDLILMKKWGCDWLKCSVCKTEICWITRGPRWGPGGQGDTSGGCRCGINGVKCHPSCTYCH